MNNFPKLTPGVVQETRVVRATVLDGPRVAHPANSDHAITLAMVDVHMRRFVNTPANPNVNPNPELDAVIVHGADDTGRLMTGTWPASVVRIGAKEVPYFVRDFALTAVDEWAAEIKRRGTLNQNASGSGNSFQAGGSIVVGRIPFER
jgi:hypothetical protein